MTTIVRLERVLVVDVETTGLDRPPEGRDRAVEVAGVLVDVASGLPLASYASLLPLPSGVVNAAEDVNGIPTALLQEMPGGILVGREYDRRWDPLLDLAGQADAFVAHRATFDRAFLPPMIARLLPWICTKFGCDWPRGRWADHLVGLALSHGLAVTSAHRAIDDALLLAAVLRRVAETAASVASGFRPQASPDAATPRERESASSPLEGILLAGLARGVGECPKCPKPGCSSYARTYLLSGDVRCARHGGEKGWWHS